MRQEECISHKQQDTMEVILATTLLIIVLSACNLATGRSRAAKQPDTIVWNKTETPLFPAHWPPTAETVWVRYTFAYGSNPDTLMDGAYVTYPLSKTEWREGIATTIVLSKDMTQASIQGIVPLDSQTRLILEKGTQVSEYCLKMAGLPDLNKPETKEMLAYYHAWFKYNGAFLDLIRENHVDFIDWVTANK